MLDRRAALVVFSVCSTAAAALAQLPVLHEFVPSLAEGEGTELVMRPGAAPEALVVDGEVVRRPAGGPLARGERPLRAVPGDGVRREEVGRRSPSFAPDRVTALETRADYYEVFSPSVRPYKRATALDGVRVAADGTPVLVLAEPSRRTREAVWGPTARAPDARPRDRFWGTFVLDFSEGREVPVPSVSPESRVLTLDAEPGVALHLERDGADNLYAVLDGPPPDTGTVRLVVLLDAPRSLAGFTAPSDQLPTVRADALSSEVAPLPAPVQRDAERFAGELGVSRDAPFDQVLVALVAHFRAFEESEAPPTDSGQIYLDLARSMRGVCRHRAYAFVITAQALGIAARFVQNEAHAWAEVRLPEHRGWLRVDLGGSARGIEEHRSGRAAPPYRPDVFDPLPQPAAYQRALEEAARASLATDSRATGGAGGATNAEATPAAPSSTGDAAGGAPSGADAGAAGATSGWTPIPARPDAVAATGPSVRRALALTLELGAALDVRRGTSVAIRGRATGDAGDAAPGLRIEVLLVDAARARERLLGVAVTDALGALASSVAVPPDTERGEYELLVRTPGDARFAPAVAR